MRLTRRVPAILSGKPSKSPVSQSPPGAPRLWNAKRRIKVSQGLPPSLYHLLKDLDNQQWRNHVSQDVIDYIDQNELLPEEKQSILRNPSKWFSRPHNVPLNQRQQVYFPDFAIVLRRTPYLGPYFASFDVPLHFNKLDMKSYLKQVYNVDVVHIRSIVIQMKAKRSTSLNPHTQGYLLRPKSKKKMTVQLVDAFEWPEVPEQDESEKDEMLAISREQLQEQRLLSEYYRSHKDPKHRKSIAEQARDLLQGKTQWKPTWKELAPDARVLDGSISAPPRMLPASSQSNKTL